MNEWKTKCAGLQWTCVSKRTVKDYWNLVKEALAYAEMYRCFLCMRAHHVGSHVQQKIYCKPSIFGFPLYFISNTFWEKSYTYAVEPDTAQN